MWTLGINNGHDTSVCLLRDREVVFATAEERLSGVKQDSSFPSRAVQAALAHASVSPDALAAVGFAWPPAIADLSHFWLCGLRGQLYRSRCWMTTPLLDWARKARGGGDRGRLAAALGRQPSCPIFEFGHHRTHALSAVAMTEAPELAVLVVDGRGARNATTIWVRRDGRLHLLERKLYPNSLGVFYSRITQYLGFTPQADEWKVMGLAAYGGPGISMDPFIQVGADDYRVAGRTLLGKDWSDLSALERAFGPARMPDEPITDAHRAIAFAAQETVERAMLALSRRAIARSGCHTLALAGGVVMNCKANGRIVESGIAEQVLVQPVASDEGTALGAAIAAQIAVGGPGEVRPVERLDLGQEEPAAAIEAALAGYKLDYRKVDDPARAAAERLARGCIVGWFQGRAEFGPRALGQRSILADPRDAAVRDRVNRIVKFREEWRPFAPSVLRERASDFFEGCEVAPFMIVTHRVRPEVAARIPAVVHADGSARVQTVDREINPLYWSLIDAFAQMTGVPVVLNTSFNLKGDPIVNTCKDAVETFFTSGLDSLVIGPFCVDKSPLSQRRSGELIGAGEIESW
jgi:carbamoyltransferase